MGRTVDKFTDNSTGHGVARLLWFRRPGLRIGLIVLTVALVLAASALTADRVAAQVRQTAITEAAQGASAIVGSFLAPLMSEDVMHDPSSTNGSAINAELQRLVSSRYFARIKVWDRSGTIVFSDLRELRGRQFEVEADLEEAFEGRSKATSPTPVPTRTSSSRASLRGCSRSTARSA